MSSPALIVTRVLAHLGFSIASFGTSTKLASHGGYEQGAGASGVPMGFWRGGLRYACAFTVVRAGARTVEAPSMSGIGATAVIAASRRRPTRWRSPK